jgi:hypothetical protein
MLLSGRLLIAGEDQPLGAGVVELYTLAFKKERGMGRAFKEHVLGWSD